MTTFFFFLALVFGWLAYNLYHPVYRTLHMTTFSFLAGWLIGELALHHIILQVIIVTLFVWNGSVTGFLGGLGFLVCITSWSAMAYFYLSSEVARENIEAGLQADLGFDYRSNINTSFRDKFPAAPNYEKIKDPRNNIDPGVEVIKNIPFGDHNQKLDIYKPRDNPGKCPVLLQIHGGAWTEKMGSKERQAIPLMSHMALRGWICASIDYRLCPSATFPEPVIDCKQGLVWVKHHIEEYGGNPQFIVVTGGSAGGQLSSLVALTPNDPQFQPGFESEDTTVQGAVPFYGVYDFTDSRKLQKNDGLKSVLESSIFKLSRDDHLDEYQQVSPLFRTTADAPPFLIVHGDKDSLVPIEEARVFADELRQASNNPVAYAEISGGQHAFDMFPSIRSEHVKHGVERFLTWVYSNHLQSAEKT